jgi:shikimate dehydrogenase
VDELTPAAKMVGAINTIVNDEGKLIGHITDGVGFVANLRANGLEIKDKKFVVLGAGGAATAIQVQLAIEGAAAITIFNAKDDFYQKGEETVARVKEYYPGFAIEIIDVNDSEKLAEKINEADYLVNATTVGMGEGNTQTLISDTSLLRADLVVADAIYNPPLTQLLKDAQANDCQIVSGKGMLLEQGKAAFQLFTGKELPVRPNK